MALDAPDDLEKGALGPAAAADKNLKRNKLHFFQVLLIL